jgi:hypothetical protein
VSDPHLFSTLFFLSSHYLSPCTLRAATSSALLGVFLFSPSSQWSSTSPARGPRQQRRWTMCGSLGSFYVTSELGRGWRRAVGHQRKKTRTSCCPRHRRPGRYGKERVARFGGGGRPGAWRSSRGSRPSRGAA